jgi:hypothetical protein
MKIVNCDGCGVKFERRTAEANRSERLGRKQYCTQSCATQKAARERGYYGRPFTPDTRPIPENSGRKLDEFSSFRGYLNKIKSRSRKECSLTLEDLKAQWDRQQGVCPVTGWTIELPASNGRRRVCHPRRASLDRIDSNEGYHVDNIRWVAAIVNFAKSTWTDEDVIEFARAVTVYAS